MRPCLLCNYYVTLVKMRTLTRPFEIKELGRKSSKIFQFKGLIGKIFRNKELEAKAIGCGELKMGPFRLTDARELARWRHGDQMEKGVGVIRALFSPCCFYIKFGASLFSSQIHWVTAKKVTTGA
jgi:hypothetical protein